MIGRARNDVVLGSTGRTGRSTLEVVAASQGRLAVGGLAYGLESQVSPVHVQKWQFYVTTLALFLVLAFPGFIARFFWRRRN